MFVGFVFILSSGRSPRGVHLFCLPKINEPNKRAPEIAFDPKINLV
jgi:hypothetical protein